MTIQLALDFGLPPSPTLENFVIGQNAAALEALRALGQGQCTHRFIYLWGASGSGKSHLLQSMASRTSNLQLHLVDDIDQLSPTAQHEAFKTWIAVQSEPQSALLAAGKLPPRDLPLREDLRSRLESALVFTLQPLNDADKLAVLQTAAAHRSFRLTDALASKLLARLPRDMGSLAAAIASIDRFSLERKRPVNLRLLREWMERSVR